MPEKPMKASCAGTADDMYVVHATNLGPVLLPGVLAARHRSDLQTPFVWLQAIAVGL